MPLSSLEARAFSFRYTDHSEPEAHGARPDPRDPDEKWESRPKHRR